MTNEQRDEIHRLVEARIRSKRALLLAELEDQKTNYAFAVYLQDLVSTATKRAELAKSQGVDADGQRSISTPEKSGG